MTTKKKESSDRLSELPEHILLAILSFMPLKSAVATSVLSRQWRCLWIELQEIKLLFLDDGFAVRLHDSEFVTHVHTLLPKFTSPFIRTCSLKLGHFDIHRLMGFEKDIERMLLQIIDGWFHWVTDRNTKISNLRELRFSIEGLVPDYYNLAPDLPLSVYRIPSSLVVLELRPWIFDGDYEQFRKASIHLPNLKTLSVALISSDPRVLEELVSSCPSLEHLSFEVRTRGLCTTIDNYAYNISSTTLKQLDIKVHGLIHVFIDAPNLEYVSVIAVYPSNCRLLNQISFVNSAPTLLACSMSVWGTSDHTFLPCDFFSAISSVKSLTLSLMNPYLIPITFSRVKHLTVKMSIEFNVLAILHQCPVLEVLTIDLNSIGTSYWPLPDSAPQCLIACVRTIKIQVYLCHNRHEDSLLRLLKYLLATAKVLQLLRINIYRPVENGSCSESHFIDELFEAPRCSAQCRIEFYGPQHRVSDRGIKLDPSMTSALLVDS